MKKKTEVETEVDQLEEMDSVASQAIYNIVIDLIAPHDFMKRDVIIGLMTIVATQYTDRLIQPEELGDFITEFNLWMQAYWSANETKH